MLCSICFFYGMVAARGSRSMANINLQLMMMMIVVDLVTRFVSHSLL